MEVDKVRCRIPVILDRFLIRMFFITEGRPVSPVMSSLETLG